MAYHTPTLKTTMMSAESPTRESAELALRLDQVIDRLGFARNPGLFRSWAHCEAVTRRHVVRQAFETVQVQAVFGFLSGQPEERQHYAPIMYLAIRSDEQAAESLHRLVWSQGVVPILLIVTPTGLQVRKTLAPPTGQRLSVPWHALADHRRLPPELASLTAVSLTGSVVWKDYAHDRRHRIDRALLDAIVELNKEVRRQFPPLDEYPALVNAVIGRFIYFFVLLDRGIVTATWTKDLKDQRGLPLCDEIARSLPVAGGVDITDKPWPVRETWALFDRIDDILNGTIFPIRLVDRRRIPSQALHLVRRTIRHGDVLRKGTRQLGFLDVSFATLRTETISAIYELFLGIESPSEQSEAGAFYTPPFLVDYILDEIDRIRPFTEKSRTLDPAAGSGIFLVGAYRRILERTMPRGGWTSRHLKKARTILEKSVFGIERNPQAANVARFSLYLTLLDYLEHTGIDDLHALVKPDRVFPALSENILSEDAFTINAGDNKHDIGRFTHLVGNPPWGSVGEGTGRSNAVSRPGGSHAQRAGAINFLSELDPREFPVTNKRLSELFMWKMRRDFMAPDAVLGVLISTRSFVARTASAFPDALAKKTRIVGMANMSHFRYRLFKGARNPAVAIFGQAREPGPFDRVWVYSPLLTSQPIGERGHLWSIVVSELDVEHHRMRDLTGAKGAWFSALMLRPIDRRFEHHLRLWSKTFGSTLGDFVRTTRLGMGRGGTPGQTGLARDLLLGAKDYRERLGLGPGCRSGYPHERVACSRVNAPFTERFSGCIVLMPRHMNEVVFVREPIAFNSSFNALYSVGGEAGGRRPVETLQGLARFFDSDVARYLYALFGKTRLLDRARMEKNDLAELPFPFGRTTDVRVKNLRGLDERELTSLFAEAAGLDESFVGVVEEYTKFRQGYEDAQIPQASLAAPESESILRYRASLRKQLIRQFGAGAEIVEDLRIPKGDGRFAYVRVKIGRKGKAGQGTGEWGGGALEGTGANARFSPHASIEYYPETSCAAVAKPWARAAWTIEQAYSDARVLCEKVLRSGRL